MRISSCRRGSEGIQDFDGAEGGCGGEEVRRLAGVHGEGSGMLRSLYVVSVRWV